MEHRVLSESEKHRAELIKSLKDKFGERLSYEDMMFIASAVEKNIQEMINLMREGKSAHEKFFSDIILNSIDAIVGFDTDYKIFLWNKGAEKMFGYEKEEIVGRHGKSLIPKKTLDKGEMKFLRSEVKNKGFIANYETERISKSGEIINVSVSRFPIFKEDGEPLGVVSITRNITKEKNLEQELRERENLALIGEVVSSIAHNLSNPLNIISGNADYLLLDKTSEDEGYEELRAIVDETTRITKSIRQLLNFAKPLIPMREKCSINEIIEDIFVNSKFLGGKNKIDLEKSLKAGIPDVNIDKELLRDVILNLINNAVQSLPSDRHGLVKVSTGTKDSYVFTEIKDNGAGIASDDIKKIFKPFFTTKGYGKGTGLGLAFSERVIKEHKGKIEVKSAVGKGTIFTVLIPFA